MHDIDSIEENFPGADERPGSSTGPITPEGKATSSEERTGRLRFSASEPVVRDRKLNRLTHGCRSEQMIIPGEDPAEFEFVMNRWFTAYDPQDFIAQHLIEELAKAHWMLKRNEKWLHQIQVRLPVDAWTWTDEHHKLLANATRYKTTAERSFYRAFNNLEAYCKRQADALARSASVARLELAQTEKARAQMAKIHMQWLKKKAEAAASRLCARQWVQVVANSQGECITACGPTNEQLVARAADADQPPEFVTRIISFVNGVPPAYEWACPNDIQRYEQTVGLQQFTYSDWLMQIEAEKVAGDSHISPYRVDLLLEND